MTPDQLQAVIWRGYGKAAAKLGAPYGVYRANGASNPTAAGNLMATLPCSVSVEGTYARPNPFGKPLWRVLIDGTQTLPGDYLVPASGPTLFIAGMQRDLPILGVECNRVLALSRPAVATSVGAIGYGGDTLATETVLATGWPASVLQGSKGEKPEVNLPGDTRSPWWVVLLPHVPTVTLRSADILTDEFDHRYVVSSAELTALGWRLTVQAAQT